MKPAGRMKFPTFGARDRVGGNGENSAKRVGYQEKNILNFRWNLPKKRKRWGKSRQMFFVEFLGEEDLSNFAGEMLLCCYDTISMQISKFARCIFHVFVAEGEVRVVHSSKKLVGEFSKFFPVSGLKLRFQIWGALMVRRKRHKLFVKNQSISKDKMQNWRGYLYHFETSSFCKWLGVST